MHAEIKERINAIRRGEVPKGYKKSREGIRPLDWPNKKMKQWLRLCERPITLKDETEYRLITVRRGFGGVDERGVLLGKNILVKNYFSVNAGDFVISKRQIAHGACGVVDTDLDGAVVSNEYNVFVPQKGTNIHMFALMMQLPHCHRLFYLMSDGVHIEKLLFKTKDWMKRDLAMPSYKEQQKIVAILDSCNKLIELKEKRLAAKELQKKYLMQQLLTGKKRLPGFDGAWEKTTLGRKGVFIKGVGISKEQSKSGDIPCIRYGEIYTYHTTIIDTFNSFISPNNIIGLVDIKKGDLLFATTGETKIEIGKCVAFIHECLAFAGGDIVIFRQNSISTIFLAYYCSSYFVRKQTARYGQGDSIVHINKNDIAKIVVSFPSREEQTAIADILSAADKELALLKEDLAHERARKKALMQLLLTGIVRVAA